MATAHAQLHDWLHLIRAEFDEIPGLRLTQPQVERMWGLEPIVAEAIVGALVTAGFLKRTHDGAYLRRDAG